MLSVVILTNNEEDRVKACLESVKWADEIIIIDGGSSDHTIEIAKKYTNKIIKSDNNDFAVRRNQGMKEAKGEWVLYLDSDEEVTPGLKKEMQSIIDKDTDTDTENYVAYAIPRKNIILGREMIHGGWWPDYVKRLFRKDALIKWEGDLHEEPVFNGQIGHLKNPIIHYKHNNLSEMVEKTNKWSEIEAKLLLESGHPLMSWWRFIRIMLTEAWFRIVVNRAFLDGTEGIIYAIYQVWSKFISYGKLWEMQKTRINTDSG